MGMILCQKHGATALSLVCPHIQAAFLGGRHGQEVREIRGILMDREVTYFYACSACLAKIPEIRDQPPELREMECLDFPDKLFELLPMCHDCLSEYRQSTE